MSKVKQNGRSAPNVIQVVDLADHPDIVPPSGAQHKHDGRSRDSSVALQWLKKLREGKDQHDMTKLKTCRDVCSR